MDKLIIVESWDICPVCKEVRDDLGRCGCDYRREGDGFLLLRARGAAKPVPSHPGYSALAGNVRLDDAYGR